MSGWGQAHEVSLLCNHDLRSYQYHMIGSGGVRALSTKLAIGVLINKPNTGEMARVHAWGSYTKAFAGGTITQYTPVSVTPSGTLSCSGTTTSGAPIIGIAMSACASGGIFEVLLYGCPGTYLNL